MASSHAVSARMKSAGFGLIEAASGVAVLHAAVQLQSPSVIAMIPVSWAKLSQSNDSLQLLLKDLIPRSYVKSQFVPAVARTEHAERDNDNANAPTFSVESVQETYPSERTLANDYKIGAIDIFKESTVGVNEY